MTTTQRGSTEHRRPSSPAARARKRILASTDRMWRIEDIPGPRSTAGHMLTELTEAGELRRVRKGLYWRGRKTPLGMRPPPTDELVSELAGSRGVGPAGLSAANALRLSTQVPRRASVAVPGRAPTSSGPVRFVSRAARTGRRTAGLNATEVAVLEALEGWTRIIEIPIPEAWDRLRDVAAHNPALRADRLARAARTEPGPVRARLIALLDDAGFAKEAAAIPAADRRAVKATQHDLAGSG